MTKISGKHAVIWKQSQDNFVHYRGWSNNPRDIVGMCGKYVAYRFDKESNKRYTRDWDRVTCPKCLALHVPGSDN